MDATVPKLPRMTMDEYLAWAMAQPSGRFELVDGEVIVMAAERVAHTLVKTQALVALTLAVRTAGLDCDVFGDGATVRVGPRTAFEPDALLRCGPRLPNDAIVTPDPLLVVEVLSPSTERVDVGRKFLGYFAVPSLRHYLVIDPLERVVLHHRRAAEGAVIETAPHDAAMGGTLVLDPPGLSLAVADLFPPSAP